MLSPSINLTVLPPSTFSAVSLLATTFQAANSLTCCLPSGVKLLKSRSAALSTLPLVASSSLTVTSSPLATVVRPFSPFTLNFTSPVLKDFSSVEPELPPKKILRPIAAVFWAILALLEAISPLFIAISLAFLVIASLLSAIFCLLSEIASAFLPILSVLAAISALFAAILSLLVAILPAFLAIAVLFVSIAVLLASALSSTFFNWETLTASLSATPSATLATFKFPALIPLSPSIFTVSLPPALLKEALFNLERSFFKATEIFLSFLATATLSSPEKSTVLPFSTATGVDSPLAERFQPYLF